MFMSRLTPEVTYVRSKDLLEKGISSTIASKEKLKHTLKTGFFVSLAIGAVTVLFTQNITSFFIPIIITNVGSLPLGIKVWKALRLTIEMQEEDMKKLAAGEVNPVDYYEQREKRLIESGKAHLLSDLSSDTSTLTPEEKEMLSKFSTPAIATY